MSGRKGSSKRLCFVVGPLGDKGSPTRSKANWLLRGIIKPVLESDEFGFEVRRADEIPEPGMIDSQVISNVIDADLVIADLSEHNANAFYEMAIRHMVEKPIIHLIDQDTPIPFDVRPFRTVQFAISDYEDIETAKADLAQQVRAVTADDYRVDNPITRARGRLELRHSATPKDQILIETLEALQARLTELEQGRVGEAWWRRRAVFDERQWETYHIHIEQGHDFDDTVAVIATILNKSNMYEMSGIVTDPKTHEVTLKVPGAFFTVKKMNIMLNAIKAIPGVSEIRKRKETY